MITKYSQVCKNSRRIQVAIKGQPHDSFFLMSLQENHGENSDRTEETTHLEKK